MAGTQKSTPAVINGRLRKALEFFDSASLLESEKLNAAGDLFVDAGIAASDVICCVRLGEHSSSGNHSEAVASLVKVDAALGKHLNTLLGLKNKASYTHQSLSATECKKMSRAASYLVEAAQVAAASASH